MAGRSSEAKLHLRLASGAEDDEIRRDALVELGRLFRASGQHRETLRWSAQALSLKPSDPKIQNAVADAEAALALTREVGLTAQDLRDRQDALSVADRDGRPAYCAELELRLIELKPDTWIHRVRAVDHLTDAGRLKEACRMASGAIDRSPTDRLGLTNLICGEAFWDRGEFTAAERYFQAAIDADPRMAGRYNYLGCCLFAQGRFDAAERVLRAGTRCAEGCVDEAFTKLGHVLRATRRYPEALTCYDQAILLDPEYREAIGAREDVELVLERFPHLAAT